MLADGRTLGELCREATGEAVVALRAVMGSDEASAAARVSAACALLDRGWGRLRQRLEVDEGLPGEGGEDEPRLVWPGDPDFVEPPAA